MPLKSSVASQTMFLSKVLLCVIFLLASTSLTSAISTPEGLKRSPDAASNGEVVDRNLRSDTVSMHDKSEERVPIPYLRVPTSEHLPPNALSATSESLPRFNDAVGRGETTYLQVAKNLGTTYLHGAQNVGATYLEAAKNLVTIYSQAAQNHLISSLPPSVVTAARKITTLVVYALSKASLVTPEKFIENLLRKIDAKHIHIDDLQLWMGYVYYFTSPRENANQMILSKLISKMGEISMALMLTEAKKEDGARALATELETILFSNWYDRQLPPETLDEGLERFRHYPGVPRQNIEELLKNFKVYYETRQKQAADVAGPSEIHHPPVADAV